MHQHRRSHFVRWFVILCIIFMVLAIVVPFIPYMLNPSPVQETVQQ